MIAEATTGGPVECPCCRADADTLLGLAVWLEERDHVAGRTGNRTPGDLREWAQNIIDFDREQIG